jgi:hypothetical protein
MKKFSLVLAALATLAVAGAASAEDKPMMKEGMHGGMHHHMHHSMGMGMGMHHHHHHSMRHMMKKEGM